MAYVLSYDLGTGGVKASLFSIDGISICFSFVSCTTYYPKQGYHEQKPLDWWGMVVEATKELLERSAVSPEEIQIIAVSGHSLGVVPIGYKGELLAEYVPIWSDSRAGRQADKFFESIPYTDWYMTTGNGFPAALYSIFKLMWIKEEMPEIYARADKFIGTKDYINYKMTGRLLTDHSYASGSGVYDLRASSYSDDFIKSSGITLEKLPEIVPSTTIIGKMTKNAAAELNLLEGIKIVAGGVDNACMALGAGCIKDGDSYMSLGSSAWIATTNHKPILEIDRKPYVFAHCVPDMFVSSTSIFAAGSSYQWLRNNLFSSLLDEERRGGPDAYEQMNTMAKASPLGAKKLLFIPSLAGGSGLDSTPHIRGAFLGLDLSHKPEDLIRSVLEGICLNLRLCLNILAEYTTLTDEMLIVGGGGKSQFWRSLFADVFNMNIIASSIEQDAGALGAAALGLVALDVWEDFSPLASLHKQSSSISPNTENVKKYEKLLSVFKEAYRLQSILADSLVEVEL